jgi:hypothetical protein
MTPTSEVTSLPTKPPTPAVLAAVASGNHITEACAERIFDVKNVKKSEDDEELKVVPLRPLLLLFPEEQSCRLVRLRPIASQISLGVMDTAETRQSRRHLPELRTPPVEEG